jgi:hypothetical protein
MSTKVTQSESHPLIVAHTAAITAYEDAAKLVPSDDLTTNQIGARRASAVRAINNLELEMVIESVPFTAWTPPHKPQSRTHSRSDKDLLARLSTIEAIRDDPKHPENIRNTADSQARTLRRQAVSRGLIEGPDQVTETEETPEATKSTRKTKTKTAGQMLADVESKVAA